MMVTLVCGALDATRWRGADDETAAIAVGSPLVGRRLAKWDNGNGPLLVITKPK